MHLATTALRQFWGDSEDRIFLGPWCRPPKDAPLAPDPWASRDALHAAAEEIEVSIDKLLPPISARLNEIHLTSFSDRYWSILISPWLSRYLHFLKDRISRLNSVFEAYPDITFTLLDPRDFRTPLDIENFQDLGFTDAYNLQIFSQLLSHKNKEGPSLSLGRETAAPEKLHPRNFSTLREKADKVLRLLSPDVIVTQLFSKRSDQLKLLASLAGRAGLFLGQLPTSPTTPNKKLRDELQTLPATTELEKAAIALLPINLPTLYLEGYAAARNATVSGWRKRPKLIASSTGWIFDEALKFAAAEFAEDGTLLIGAQHGGGYGQHLDIPTETIERRGRDQWISWGWSDGKSVTPLPSPQTAPLAGIRDPKATFLYFTVNGFPLYPYLIHGFPIGHQIEENIAMQEKFLQGLEGDAAKNLRVRPYWHDWGWNQKARLKAARPDAQTDIPESTFVEGLRTTRLAVIDNVETCFLEALAADIPVIAFQEKRFHRVRPSAAEDFKLLVDAKMLFSDPEAAAAHACSVYANPNEWWESAPVRKAKKRWVEKYAGGTKPWLPAWRNFILGMIKPKNG